ncbi:MAG: hypothetical protein GX029_02345 [Pseudomonadaceae bacterium]|nr:hypothetical protein [Pseudomonadaceae bacterium]
MKTTNQVKQAQCPHCQSIFSVSQEEIELALGAVRCGECMKIFNASYHLIDAPLVANLVASFVANKAYKKQLAPTALASDLNKPSLLSPSLITDEKQPASKQQQFDIPTLQDAEEGEEEEKQLDASLNSKKINTPIVASLFLLLVTLLVGGWLFINQKPPISYAFTDVGLTPSSNNKKINVHFKISNITEQNLPLPNLTIQLLNLSAQPVSSELIMAADLKTNLSELAAAASHEIQVSVDRPNIFVQGARIQVHLNDSKL